jgi:hypothetical protein
MRYSARRHRYSLLMVVWFLFSFFLFSLGFFPVRVRAAINEQFTYQGKIVDKTNGTNLTNSDASCVSVGGADTCDFRVSLYSAVSGGTLQWQQTFSNVELYDNDGIFNLTMDGSNCGGDNLFDDCYQNGSTDSIFTAASWVEVEFDPDGDADFAESETFARTEMSAVPYAFHAKTADSATSATDAGTLDSVDSTSFLRSDASDEYSAGNTLTMAGTFDSNGDVSFADTNISFDGASTTFTQTTGAFTFAPASGSDLSISLATTGDFVVNNDDLFVDTNTGYVGVGNTLPSAQLYVTGTFGSSNNAFIGGTAGLGLFFNTPGSYTYGIYRNGSDNLGFRSNSDTDQFVIQATTGYVGIGTTAPSLALDVVGSAQLSGALAVNGDSITADGATLVVNAAGNVDVQDALNADSITSDAGVSVAAGNSYTGAGAVTLSSGGSAALTLDSASGTVTIAASDTLGNGTWSVNSSGVGTSLTSTDLSCTNCIGPTEITDLTLATDTAGDFVNSVTGGSGISSTGATSGENISHTLSLGALTGDWDAGGYEIRASTLESDVTTGTAPFTIASTTVVTNLNADLLDGVSSASFLRSDGSDAFTSGTLTINDDLDMAFGTGNDWLLQYDEGVDDQLLFITANTAAIATTDPMVEFLVGATPTANQQVFGVGKGTQASNTALLTLDEDGDLVVAGTFSATGAISGSNLSGSNTGDQTITLTGDVTGSGTGSFAATIAANSVALATDTTGDFANSITGGSGIASTGATSGENISHTLSLSSLTGDWDAGSYEVRASTLESDVTTGTAPLTIASTTVVTNLNADLLDGVSSGSFLRSDGSDAFTSGTLTINDDLDVAFGSGNDWLVQYDEGVDNQLLFITANTAATATTDPMVEFLVGASPTADQQVFGVSKGTQASNTALLTLDEDGDLAAVGTISATGALSGSNLSGSNTGDQTIALTGDVTGSGTGSFAATIAANSVALSTDTTGDFVNSVTGGSGIASTGATSGEDISHTLSLSSLTGDWDAGGYEIRASTLESDVTTGTAPLTIASTTKVTNLNVDWLDGFTATAFLRSGASDAFTSGTLTINDSQSLAFGTSDDFTISHGGTNTVFDNTFATGSTQFQLGTDTTATALQVLNNSGSGLFEVDGSGNVGVGTTDPSAILDVYSSGSTNYPLIYNASYYDTDNGPAETMAVNFYPDKFQFYSKITGANTSFYVQDADNNAARLAFQFTGNGGSTEILAGTSTGNVGIGTTVPAHKLDVAGNIGLSASSYVNWGATDGDSGYGFKDNSGTLQYKSSGGSWADIGSGGGGGSATGPAGSIQFSDGSAGFSADPSNFFWDDTNDLLGIGNSVPGGTLHLTDTFSTANELFVGDLTFTGSSGTAIGIDLNIDYAGTTSTAGFKGFDMYLTGDSSVGTGDKYGFFLDTDSNYDDSLLYLATNASSVFEVTTTQATFGVPLNVSSSGDVSVANDLNFTNTTASYVTSDGPMYIQAGNAGESESLYLSSAGTGDVYVDDALFVEKSGATVGTFNRTSSDGTVISIKQAGTEEGTISVSTTTVSYNAFTGSHYAWSNDVIEKGTLVTLTGDNKHLGDRENSEILYGIAPTTVENDSKVLGSYLATLESTKSKSTSNPELVMAAGNGVVWVVETQGNLTAGDYLVSSSVAGHAQKDGREGLISNIVARLAESIDWTEVSDTVEVEENGIPVTRKRVLASVLFGSFQSYNVLGDVLASTTSFTDSSEIVSTPTNFLAKATFSDVVITGLASFGFVTVDSLENSINIAGPACYSEYTGTHNKDLCRDQTIYMQKNLAGNLDLFNGAIVFDPSGDTTVTGKLRASVLSAKKVNIDFENSSIDSAGKAVILAGDTSVTIETESATLNSLIFVTPQRPVEVGSSVLEEGKVLVEINSPLDEDLEVQWWVIN